MREEKRYFAYLSVGLNRGGCAEIVDFEQCNSLRVYFLQKLQKRIFFIKITSVDQK